MGNIVLKVGGVVLPAPDVYSVGQEVLGSFERTAGGSLVGDLVGVKAVLTAGWQILDDVDFKAILGFGKAGFVNVEYFDPEVGVVKKVMMARPSGGRVALDSAKRLWWRDVGCVFVER